METFSSSLRFVFALEVSCFPSEFKSPEPPNVYLICDLIHNWIELDGE